MLTLQSNNNGSFKRPFGERPLLTGQTPGQNIDQDIFKKPKRVTFAPLPVTESTPGAGEIPNLKSTTTTPTSNMATKENTPPTPTGTPTQPASGTPQGQRMPLRDLEASDNTPRDIPSFMVRRQPPTPGASGPSSQSKNSQKLTTPKSPKRQNSLHLTTQIPENRGFISENAQIREATSNWTGKALKYLTSKNSYSHQLIRFATESEDQRTLSNTQVSYALIGAPYQCHTCFKYISTVSYGKVHEKKCSLEKQWRLVFDQIPGKDLFYCYFGCSTFNQENELAKHLYDNHIDQLADWGIGHAQLRLRYALDDQNNQKEAEEEKGPVHEGLVSNPYRDLDVFESCRSNKMILCKLATPTKLVPRKPGVIHVEQVNDWYVVFYPIDKIKESKAYTLLRNYRAQKAIRRRKEDEDLQAHYYMPKDMVFERGNGFLAVKYHCRGHNMTYLKHMDRRQVIQVFQMLLAALLATHMDMHGFHGGLDANDVCFTVTPFLSSLCLLNWANFQYFGAKTPSFYGRMYRPSMDTNNIDNRCYDLYALLLMYKKYVKQVDGVPIEACGFKSRHPIPFNCDMNYYDPKDVTKDEKLNELLTQYRPEDVNNWCYSLMRRQIQLYLRDEFQRRKQ